MKITININNSVVRKTKRDIISTARFYTNENINIYIYINVIGLIHSKHEYSFVKLRFKIILDEEEMLVCSPI